MEFFATAARGTERVLAAELAELGLAGVRVRGGGVAFTGGREDGWRACFGSRIAQRIQLEVAAFPAASAEDLYRGVRAVPWEGWLTPKTTLAVSAFIRDCPLTHSGFVALKVKDAVVDRIRGQGTERPTVSREDPDVQIFAHWVRERVTLYLDLAGVPLFKRGWRGPTGEAPLKETLAAALLRLAGWDRQQPLLDPMCGAGTIAIEAALWAANLAPGLFRERFGFERWADFTDDDAERVRALRGELRRSARGQVPRITACDCDPQALAAATANARAAGVRISLRQADVRELRPCEPKPLLVTNPPYGLRLGAAAGEAFQRDLAATFCRLHGWRIGIFTGNPLLPKLIPPRPMLEAALWNGDIECRFLLYDMP
ncbi:MAG: THUMP domain-containing protein [Lentisphaeria bacterium]|jgi:putative N6-adenine-specific DNA methylase